MPSGSEIVWVAVSCAAVDPAAQREIETTRRQFVDVVDDDIEGLCPRQGPVMLR